MLLQRPGPGGEEIPARAAGGFRVGGDDLDAVLDQVAPVVQALGVALAHQEDDGRGVGRVVVGQRAAPVGADLAGRLGDGVDVGLKRQRDDVGLEPVDDGAGLLAGTGMGVLDAHRLALRLLPVFCEGGVELAIELARRVVGDVDDRLLRQGRHGSGEGQCGGKGYGQEQRSAGRGHVGLHSFNAFTLSDERDRPARPDCRNQPPARNFRSFFRPVRGKFSSLAGQGRASQPSIHGDR